ncbi:MAG TPA: penicillin-binding protein 2 [Gammaproteobacteria bacterium]|jgi:penicillin-binding protein 2|nr:penicillin-binding protein 2 [Gammaproteobacteria bacterium]
MDRIQNTALENKIFSNRLLVSIFFIVTLTIVLLAKIFNLQILQHELYKDEALGNQMSVLPIIPTRGKIFDRNGKVLASNELSYMLTITPEKVKNVSDTINNLEKLGIINSDDISQYKKNRKRYKRFNNIPLKINLSESEVANFVVNKQFSGVEVEHYYRRRYPNNSSSSHVIGYVSRMSKQDKALYDEQNYLGTSFVGKSGIERQYETLLHGTSGRKQIERNVTGRVVDTKTIEAAKSGKDIYLSIDIDLQILAESLLHGRRGSIVAVDINNGEVLTLVSSPNYDPNLFANGISQLEYQSLQESLDIPLLNRAIQGMYPPGSTIKPMVALAGLENGIITNESKTFCPGYFKLPNVKRKFNDWKRSGHGWVDVEEAISQSCDVFFYSLSDKTGIDILHDNLKYFNFGKKTGIDIPGELGGVLPSREWKKINKNEPWYRGETLISGIGQGFITTTPLQLAVATAALASRGKIIQPKILKNIRKENSDIEISQPSSHRQININDIHNWEDVLEGMKRTIYSPTGTARRLNRGLKYTLAGKTGTAQVFGLDAEEEYIADQLDERLRDHALFTGYAPIENPQIAIAVIVENAGSGSSKAAPLARLVLDKYFEKLQSN